MATHLEIKPNDSIQPPASARLQNVNIKGISLPWGHVFKLMFQCLILTVPVTIVAAIAWAFFSLIIAGVISSQP